jgi:hypothetical protein
MSLLNKFLALADKFAYVSKASIMCALVMRLPVAVAVSAALACGYKQQH